MSLRTVPAGSAHAPVIAALHAACFDDPWDEKAVLSLLAMPGAYGWIALEDDEYPKGFLLLRVAADEAEILSIGVLAEARRKGVAGTLLKAAVDTSTGAAVMQMFLEVARDNDPAIGFYEEAGFRSVGIRKDYYQRSDGRVDALIFRREIPA